MDLEAFEKAYLEVEDMLIDLRNMRISIPFAANGVVVREADGTESSMIRSKMNWHEKIAYEMNSKHSDTVAVVRWGKAAKRATRRRNRRLSKKLIGDDKK